MGWKPRRVVLPAVVKTWPKEAVPVRDPEPPPGPSVAERELTTIARQLVANGSPETVHTLTGHVLSVAYFADAAGVREIEFRGWCEVDGHQRELEVGDRWRRRSPISERTFQGAAAVAPQTRRWAKAVPAWGRPFSCSAASNLGAPARRTISDTKPLHF